MFDLQGRTGWQYNTDGCIRTTSGAMAVIYNLHFKEGDRLEFIICFRDERDIDKMAGLVFWYLFFHANKDLDTAVRAAHEFRNEMWCWYILGMAEMVWKDFFNQYYFY
jgi:hypothetical protein